LRSRRVIPPLHQIGRHVTSSTQLTTGTFSIFLLFSFAVFHHVCYEGAVDLELVYDMNDRHALEVQIMEFGQIPKQLFTKPHVRKIGYVVEKPLSQSEEPITYKVDCLDEIRLHKEAVTCALRHGSRVISVGKDGALKVYDVSLRKQIRSIILCQTPLSSCVMIDDNIVAAGSWDNEM
jgi:factor associated with neutral sphingomyelinase activation